MEEGGEDVEEDVVCGSGVRHALRLRWHLNDDVVGQLSWCCPSSSRVPALVLRLALLLVFSAIMGLVIAFARASDWASFSLVTLALQWLAFALLAVASFCAPVTPWAVLLLEVGIAHAMVATVVFWSVLAPMMGPLQGHDLLMMLLVHGANALLLLLELSLDRFVFVPSHVLLLWLIDAVYLVCVLIPFQAATGTAIYPGVSGFDTPGFLVALIAGAAALGSLVFFGVMGLSFLKRPRRPGLALCRSCGSRRSSYTPL